MVVYELKRVSVCFWALRWRLNAYRWVVWVVEVCFSWAGGLACLVFGWRGRLQSPKLNRSRKEKMWAIIRHKVQTTQILRGTSIKTTSYKCHAAKAWESEVPLCLRRKSKMCKKCSLPLTFGWSLQIRYCCRTNCFRMGPKYQRNLELAEKNDEYEVKKRKNYDRHFETFRDYIVRVILVLKFKFHILLPFFSVNISGGKKCILKKVNDTWSQWYFK